MLVNDELYFRTFCKLLEAVVKAGGLEIPVESLQKNHFYQLSRKINRKSGLEYGVRPTTLRDYRYIYKQQKKFSVRQNRLDLLSEFLGYDGWNEYKKIHFHCPEIEQNAEPKVRLLVLPDRRVGVVKKFEGQIAELIINRYEELKYELDLDRLEILFEDSLSSCPTGIEKIHDLGKAHQADIVLWTEYIHGKDPLIRVPALLVDSQGGKSTRAKQPYKKAEALVDILEGAFLEAADIKLFHLLGTSAFKEEEIDKARFYFEKVLALAPDHSGANYYINLLHQNQINHAEDTLSQKLEEELVIEITASKGTVTTRAVRGKEEKSSISKKNGSQHFFQSPNTSMLCDKSSLNKHLLVLKGDNHVLKSKDLEPLVRSMLIHEDEPIIFLTSHTDMSLMSLSDLNIFGVQAKRKEIPMKEALVSFKQQLPDQDKGLDNEHLPIQWLVFSPQNHLQSST